MGIQLRLDLWQLQFIAIKAKRLDADTDGSGGRGGKRQLWRILQKIQLLDLLLQVHRVRVPNDLEQGHGHCEDHEDVDHLHVGSGGQAISNSDMAGDGKLNLDLVARYFTYKVPRTRRAVRLTPMTMSR